MTQIEGKFDETDRAWCGCEHGRRFDGSPLNLAMTAAAVYAWCFTRRDAVSSAPCDLPWTHHLDNSTVLSAANKC